MPKYKVHGEVGHFYFVEVEARNKQQAEEVALDMVLSQWRAVGSGHLDVENVEKIRG